MAGYNMMKNGIEPGLDTSLGLIYRLNNLWREIDSVSIRGQYDEWSIILDRVFCNLLYREEAIPITNLAGEIVTVRITNTEYTIWKVLSANIFKAKSNLILEQTKNRRSSNIPLLKSRWYNELIKKDLWMRKFMHNTLKLYLKEEKKAPGTSLFGNFSARRK